ncbi:hypothetical protein [Hyphomonas sp.]|uniref:hypothetical protein n=1 Tax=Hyphomonas sp. TaxID=87 RepID=UPI0025C51B1F|nr:hypothetical protein [Hyphomonas sp.]|tara:strand:- start:386 stop:559 length:174 start_codon:yes stop_codon:yes gene_type:complete
MIDTVTKFYYEDGTFAYIVVFKDGSEWTVPHDDNNRHYQEILDWVEEGNTITDNGGG